MYKLNVFDISDTTLVNYGESIQTTNLESEIVETYSDSSQNVETIHRADELGNIYTDNTDNFINSQPETLNDVTDQYDQYLNDYSFTNTDLVDQSTDNISEKFGASQTEIKDNIVMPDMNDFQQTETTNYESQSAEDLLMSEREREKKSKKELEEEEREKMQ